ncbi:HPr family phosphocarrier protein [candidate division WOR-3 bacterium]|uniref:HPr family phosphocarrier protein n=1 Tax=candidate division WOR-3 bacterium TaxID=2052148 RepID=A0A9D5K8J0_UNCW3|nr:HPr family phosphocarrier protein [candidate division WOR-3 bacterium]MBD3364283.1 HPr family phosphocarrier protein [candidate division WOR-3 bacterium]
MTAINLIIRNKVGLHARPAAQFVKLAEGFAAEIWVTKDGMRVNGKSILSLLTLAAEEGSELTLEAEGPDEKEALKALRELLEEEGE